MQDYYAIHMSSIASALIDIVENILIAVLALAGGYFLARVTRVLVQRLLERIKVANTLGPSIPALISSILYYLILSIAGVIGLLAFGVPASLLILGISAVVLIFALALQQSVSNFAATVIFLVFQPFRRGEVVETMGRVGMVREILLFNTVIQMPDHRLVSLPNSKVQDNGIVNYTRMGYIWADVKLLIRYDQDLERVRTVIAAIILEDTRILPNPPPEIIIDELGEKGICLSVRPSVAPEHATVVRNDLRAQIHTRFQVEGIKFMAQWSVPANPNSFN
jgi:small conductance mechanosensitive channel